MILKDAFVSINGVNVSAFVRSLALSPGVEPQDDTAMGATTRTSEAGLKIWALTVQFFQSFAAGQVDATLYPLIGAAPFPIIVRPTSAAKSATNPEFTGSMILTSYTPISGEVGSEHMVQAEFAAAGNLARATS